MKLSDKKVTTINEDIVFKTENAEPTEYFDLLVAFQSLNENLDERYDEELLGIKEIELALQNNESIFYIKESECLNVVLIELNVDVDAVAAAMKIRDSPTTVISEIVPINEVVKTRMDYILEKAVELAGNKMIEGDSFTVRYDIRGERHLKFEQELFTKINQELIEKLNLKYDEVDPDWVVQIEVVGENTGISVLKPTELFKKNLINLESFKEDIYGPEEMKRLDNINLNNRLISVLFVLISFFFMACTDFSI
ncbi:MAG: THUMP domain-containing protein [Methanobacterium paludis]|nr:THUMP domain-containing protein [Methanobacterium paludis]